MKFKIPYPQTKEGKKFWNKEYSLNAIYSGKHWAKRSEDKDIWHRMVTLYLKHQKVAVNVYKTPVEVIYRWNDALDIDGHAYMGKMIMDVLKGHLIKDDSRKYVVRVIHEFHDKDFVEVEVREVE